MSIVPYRMTPRFHKSSTNLKLEFAEPIFFLLRDIDLSYGIVNYQQRQAEFREERKVTRGKIYSDEEWQNFQRQFIEEFSFSTSYAKESYAKELKDVRAVLGIPINNENG